MLRLKTALVLAMRYLFLTRYSWLLALVLLALVPISLEFMPGLLGNLFVFESPRQIFYVSWISIWCAATVMETLRSTTMNAHLRFDDYRIAAQEFRDAWGINSVDDSIQWYRSRVGWIMLLLGLAVAIGIWYRIMEACIEQTTLDRSASWDMYVPKGDFAAMRAYCWRQAIYGLATTLVLLASLNGVMIWLYEWRIRSTMSERTRWMQPFYATCGSIMGPGYFRTEPDSASPTSLHLAHGHFRLVLYTFAFLGWYIVNYVTVTGEVSIPIETSPYSALFYALLSLLLLLYFLPGIAFYWDRYRVPVPLLLLGTVLILYRAYGTDHYYALNESPNSEPPYEAYNLVEVFDEWDFPKWPDGKRTLVVVDASGGGIQAAAWTTQVLIGLDQRYGNDFSRSIGLISSVSGGSVGTMFYLANRSEMNLTPDPAIPIERALTEKAVEKIREASQASALEATAWGLAYPDTLRTVLPFVVDEHIDRGWAIEQVWQRRMMSTGEDDLDRSNLTIIDLAKAIRRNQLPIPVFNATIMENGKRFQISPVLAPPQPLGQDESLVPDAAVQLLEEFPRARPLISTAARLSATFPYVTPAARSDYKYPSTYGEFHVVDGAYVDNEGAVTSVDWINRLLSHYENNPTKDRPFDRVVLLRIQAFPTSNLDTDEDEEVKAATGWRSALVGPLDAMMTVRSASQAERGDLEVGLLANVARARTEVHAREAELNTQQALIDSSARPTNNTDRILSNAEIARMEAMSRDVRTIASTIETTVKQFEENVRETSDVEVFPIVIDFRSPDPDTMIPMSWKLTSGQKENILGGWQVVADREHQEDPLKLLDEFFEHDLD